MVKLPTDASSPARPRPEQRRPGLWSRMTGWLHHRSATEDALAAAEQQAHQAEARLREALDALPEGIVFLDKEGRYILWNQKYAEIYHRSADLFAEGVTLLAYDYRGLGRSGPAPAPYGMDYDSPEPPDCYLCIGQCPCTKGILNFACNCNYETFVDCDYFNNENASKKDKSEDIEYVRNLYHSPEFRNFPRDKQFAIELYLGTRGEELRMSPEQESQLDPTILAKFHGDLPL